MEKKPSSPSTIRYMSVGFAVGFVAEYLFLNLNPIERLAAEAGGFQAWSIWQLPFAVPGGVAGALLGAAVATLRRLFRSRRGV